MAVLNLDASERFKQDEIMLPALAKAKVYKKHGMARVLCGVDQNGVQHDEPNYAHDMRKLDEGRWAEIPDDVNGGTRWMRILRTSTHARTHARAHACMLHAAHARPHACTHPTHIPHACTHACTRAGGCAFGHGISRFLATCSGPIACSRSASPQVRTRSAALAIMIRARRVQVGRSRSFGMRQPFVRYVDQQNARRRMSRRSCVTGRNVHPSLLTAHGMERSSLACAQMTADMDGSSLV